MAKFALQATLEARPGKEHEVEQFLRDAVGIVQKEAGTRSWFALRFGPRKFGIFDTFDDEAGRQAHVAGEVAKALFAQADELFSSPPQIEQIEILAEKLP
jgi:quinol monooxygenase YgiN